MCLSGRSKLHSASLRGERRTKKTVKEQIRYRIIAGRVKVLAVLPFFLFSFLLFMACSNPTPEELASLAAKGYYDHLLRGEYEAFLEGKAASESLPADYREQLLAGFRQFVAEQKASHGGIREVRISNAKTDTLQHFTSVFLICCYGDSTNEEIVVPMIETPKGWRMK